MAEKRVTLSEAALGDLESIGEWYEEQGVPEVGERLLLQILEHIETLADYPEIGRIVPEFGQTFLRELIHPPFRIVYRIDPGRVRIVRVWPCRRRHGCPSGRMETLRAASKGLPPHGAGAHSCRDLFIGKGWNLSTLTCMLNGHRTHCAVLVQIDQRVFIEISGFRYQCRPQFDVERIRVLEVAYLHGL